MSVTGRGGSDPLLGPRQPIPEPARLVEEARVARMVRLVTVRGGGRQLAQQFALAAGQVRGRLHEQLDDQVAALAPAYSNADLGPLKVSKTGNGVTFAFRTMETPMGTRKNEDGTISFVALDPTLLFFPLVVGTKDGAPTLTARDSQHEFVFTPVK